VRKRYSRVWTLYWRQWFDALTVWHTHCLKCSARFQPSLMWRKSRPLRVRICVCASAAGPGYGAAGQVSCAGWDTPIHRVQQSASIVLWDIGHLAQKPERSHRSVCRRN
jgi:hypothetical protein